MTVHRRCGGCTLCCKLLPVQELNKAANEKCRHQGRDGCAVYRPDVDIIGLSLAKKRFAGRFPVCCAAWSCRWLNGTDTSDQARPDRSHYVIDVMPDFVESRDASGQVFKTEVVQVWIDPQHRDAYKDPALRAYLLRRGEERKVALIRFNERDGFVLVPPNMSESGEWLELRGGAVAPEHTMGEKLEALGRVTIDFHH